MLEPINYPAVLYTIAGLCFIAELVFLGISGPLLFIALATLSTGILVDMAIVSGVSEMLGSVSIFSIFFTAILWNPMEKIQNTVSKDESSDMIGKKLPVIEVITKTSGKVRYSGIDWTANIHPGFSEDGIEVGNLVTIVSVSGTLLLVVPDTTPV